MLQQSFSLMGNLAHIQYVRCLYHTNPRTSKITDFIVGYMNVQILASTECILFFAARRAKEWRDIQWTSCQLWQLDEHKSKRSHLYFQSEFFFSRSCPSLYLWCLSLQIIAEMLLHITLQGFHKGVGHRQINWLWGWFCTLGLGWIDG